MTTSRYVHVEDNATNGEMYFVDNDRDQLISDNQSNNIFILVVTRVRCCSSFLPYATPLLLIYCSCSRNTLVGYQASPRGGTVRVTYIPGTEKADVDNTVRQGTGQASGRVKLEGKAVTVFRGLFRR